MAGDDGKGVYKEIKVENAEKPPIYEIPKGFGARHTQAFVLFVSLSVAFTLRAQLSVTMVAMTNMPTSHNLSNITENLTRHYEDEDKWNIYKTYDWSKPTQSMIIYSFLIGYTMANIPMGIVAQKYGGKLPIMIALFANGVISMLMPWAPIFGGWVLLASGRFLQGATQAAFFPAIHTMLGKWAPKSEKGRLTTYIFTGGQFGTIFIFQVSGLLAGSPTFGWPSTFWLCGILSFLSFGLLAWLGAASPHEHPTITQEELFYILGNGTCDAPKKRQTPWRAILTSKSVWGIVITHCGSSIGFLYSFTEVPVYMNKILGVDIKRNGVYSSLPYMAMLTMTLIFGYVSDYLANNNLMTVINIRRSFNSIGMLVMSVFLIAFVFTPSNYTVTAVVLLIVSLGMHSGICVGFLISYIDLSPNFAGPVMALGNTLASLSGLTVPVLVSLVVKDVNNQWQWQLVCLIIAGIHTVTNVLYMIWIKADIQSWNYNGDDEPEDKKAVELKLMTENSLDVAKT